MYYTKQRQVKGIGNKVQCTGNNNSWITNEFESIINLKWDILDYNRHNIMIFSINHNTLTVKIKQI